MKIPAIALTVLCGCPLAAQAYEVGLFVGQQSYPSPHVDVAPGTTKQVYATDQVVYGARFGYTLTDLGPASFQLTAGLQPEFKSTLTASISGVPVPGEGELKQSFWSAGAMFNFKALVAVGAGLEFRSERLSETGDSTTYNRVWARVNAGYAFPTPAVKPFIGVEAVFPLSTTDNNFSTTADLLKSLAPRSQVGVYAGIRF